MKHTTFVGVMAVLSVGAAGYWAFRPVKDRAGAARPVCAANEGESSEALQTMRRDLDGLEAEIARLRSQSASPATKPTPVAREASSDEPDNDASRREAPPPRRDPAEVFQKLDDHIAREAKDSAWGTATETVITSAFGTEALAGSSLLFVECRSTVCRVEVAHQDARARARFLEDVRNVPPFDRSAGAVRPDGDPTSNRTVLYMAREGQRLPPIDG